MAQATPAISKPAVLAVDDKRANLVALDALLGEEYRLLFANSGRKRWLRSPSSRTST